VHSIEDNHVDWIAAGEINPVETSSVA
jgi:hypothetical protein